MNQRYVNNFLIVFLLLTTLVGGQSLTLDEISARIEQAKQTEGGASQAVVTEWEKARELAEKLGEVKAQTASLKSKASLGANLPDLTVAPEPPAEASLEELNGRLNEVATALETSRERLEQATADLAGLSERISALRELLAETREQVAEFVVLPEGETALQKAQRERSVQEEKLLQAQLENYQAEQTFLQIELEQLPKRIRLRKEHNNRLVEMKESLQARVANLRRQQAQNTELVLKKTSKEFSHIPELAALISEISELNQERTGEDGLQAKIKAAIKYDNEINSIYGDIVGQQASAQEKIDLLEKAGMGIDTDTGIILREQRAKLPSTVDLRKKLSNQIEVGVRSEVELFELRTKLKNDPPLDEKTINKILEKYSAPERQESGRAELQRSDVTALLEQRKSLLESLISERENLKAILARSNRKAQLTIDAIKDYSVFLDQRLLWSRSTSPIQLAEPKSELINIASLFQPQMFERAWKSIQENWFPRFVPALVLATIFLFGLFRRKRLKKVEKEASEKAARRNCTSIMPTVETLASSVLIAATFPAAFFLLALLISDPMAFRMGCLNAGTFLLVSSLVYRFSRPATLFESHFKFSEIKARRIQKTLRFYIPLMLPFVFGIGALCVNGGVGTSGRIVFMVTMMIVATLAHQLFHPKHSIVGNPEKATLLSKVSYILALGLPLSFLTGAALGFFSSVLTLRAQVLATAGVLLGAFLLIRFLTRWILVSRRNLAIQQALQRREATLAHRARQENGELENEPDAHSLEELKARAVDVVEVEQQTSQLVRFGVYFSVLFTIFSIWSSSLTALSVLDQKPLWPGTTPPAVEKQESPNTLSTLVPTGANEEVEQAADTLTELVLPPSDDFVSWQDFLLSLFIFLLTFVAARNIPGLLSLTVFSRLNLGPGGNFAFTTIVRYFIVMTGVVIGLSKVGITWDKVQWLAAAITLGIGFGLQEIFANFVAGLILLFERPLRLGDIVTIGNVSGKVTEIKIRATTIQQFNNRDLVVPNKDFITNQLTNWTLKDSILRFELPVGIAYGSDTRKAKEILTRILAEHPNVLEEPAPAVIFNSFGASTLDFLIRAHVGQTAHLVETQNDLHFQIDDAFREAGIELAFPQQDIHVKSLPDGLTLPPMEPK